MIKKIIATFIWSVLLNVGLLIYEDTSDLMMWIGWGISFYSGLEIVDIWKKELQQFKRWLWSPFSKG